MRRLGNCIEHCWGVDSEIIWEDSRTSTVDIIHSFTCFYFVSYFLFCALCIFSIFCSFKAMSYSFLIFCLLQLFFKKCINSSLCICALLKQNKQRASVFHFPPYNELHVSKWVVETS